MNLQKSLAIIFIVIGMLVLAYGGFSYTQETHKTQIGPLHLELDEKRRVNIPIWAGICSLVLGGVLLAMKSKR